eukprot:Platyproteum_vivax@DN5756_c0_g1_i1.p1
MRSKAITRPRTPEPYEKGEVVSQAVFNVRVEDLFNTLLSTRDLTVMAKGSPADMTRTKGGRFSLHGGQVVGRIVDIKLNKEIVQTWTQIEEWPYKAESTVTFTFDYLDRSKTRVQVKQVDVPLVDKYGEGGMRERAEEGWEIFFWQPIEKAIGYKRDYSR